MQGESGQPGAAAADRERFGGGTAHGIPAFLDQLAIALRLGISLNPEIGRSALLHGRDLQDKGYSVGQVVHDYGDVCQSITELAIETNAPVGVDEFRTLNACLDDAIAGAVTEFGRQWTESALDTETQRGNERIGFLAHELRNLLNTAVVAFDILKSGNVGLGGSTGSVLHRSLVRSEALIRRSLAEVRLTHGVQNVEQFPISGFVKELAPTASMEAEAKGVTFTVTPVDAGLVVEADRQVLAAAVGNLLNNAFKFTRARTTVTLRVGASAERVLIEVHDECGGLPDADVDGLFRPFEQRSADRSGLGLGLAFSRWAVRAHNGRLYARNLPGKGCIFTIDLPRMASTETI